MGAPRITDGEINQYEDLSYLHSTRPPLQGVHALSCVLMKVVGSGHHIISGVVIFFQDAGLLFFIRFG